MKITYLYGDVREPCTECNAKTHYIVHCCNAIGRMGSGVAKALFEKWPIVRSDYLQQYTNRNSNNMKFLGEVFPVLVGHVQEKRVCQAGYTKDSEKKVEFTANRPLYVVNMIGQQGVGFDENGNPPVRYEAIASGLRQVAEFSNGNNIAVHIPYLMGSDLAGGKWELVEKIIQEELVDKGIPVYVYDIMNRLGLKKDLNAEEKEIQSEQKSESPVIHKENDIFAN